MYNERKTLDPKDSYLTAFMDTFPGRNLRMYDRIICDLSNNFSSQALKNSLLFLNLHQIVTKMIPTSMMQIRPILKPLVSKQRANSGAFERPRIYFEFNCL